MADNSRKELFAPSEFWRFVIILIILILGLGTRLYDLTDPPLDYSATRQLRSAMISRGKYYASLPDAPEWRREIARKQQNLHGTIEPEIIEDLTAFTYRLVGGEYPWISRIYSSIFWVLGGIALYFLTKGIVSGDGSILSLVYYLFVPFGLIVSRISQPDPLMTALIVLAWMSFYYWYKTSSWKWAILSGISAGFALYIKSTSLFFLLPGMASVVLVRNGIKDMFKDLQVWTIIGLSALPGLIYNLWGIFVTGALGSLLKGRFFPQLWNDSEFYFQWMTTLFDVAGHLVILLIGIFGIFLIKNKLDRTYLLWIWVGYLLYGFTLSYHISTHSYYSLPVIPLLAISLGAVADRIIDWVKNADLSWVILVGTAFIILAGVGGGYYLYARKDFRHEPPYFQKVAAYIEPGAKVVALSQDYGFRFSYYGWQAAKPWKGTEDLIYVQLKESEIDSFSDRFAEFSSGYDYFVITRMEDFRRQDDLYRELYDHYAVVVEGGGYVIFDLRERID